MPQRLNVSEPTDEVLIQRALSGDGSAFGLLVRRWYRPVLALCQSRLVSSADAEDAAQESFLRAHQQLPQLRQPSRFGGWLRGIAAHVCIDLIRKLSRTVTPAGDVAEAAAPTAGPAHAVEDSDERQHLVRMIHELPETNREVLLLHYFDEMTYDEMAAWLGVARATVNERLSKGRAMLRRRLLQSQRS